MTREEAIEILYQYSVRDMTYPKEDIEAFELAIKALEQEPKWIPVSERLPEENKTVMASTKFGVYPEVRYSKEYGWEWAYEAGADYWTELKATVTAWTPLPSPYDPQESEE